MLFPYAWVPVLSATVSEYMQYRFTCRIGDMWRLLVPRTAPDMQAVRSNLAPQLRSFDDYFYGLHMPVEVVATSRGVLHVWCACTRIYQSSSFWKFKLKASEEELTARAVQLAGVIDEWNVLHRSQLASGTG